MQVLILDSETVTLQKFVHPTDGLMRIIGDYDENPGDMTKGGLKTPYYKCQQVMDGKQYFAYPKSEVIEYIKEYLLNEEVPTKIY